MEYHAFANEFIKIAGSTRALYAQEKADREFTALADSSKPTAAPKAFAKGFAVGAGIPMFITANMHLVNKQKHIADAARTVRRTHIAEALGHLNIQNPVGVAAALDNSVFTAGGKQEKVQGKKVWVPRARAEMDPALRQARFALDAHIAQGKLNPSALGRSELTGALTRHQSYVEKLRHYEGKGSTSPGSRARADIYPTPKRLSGPGELAQLEAMGADLLKKRGGAPQSVSKTYWRNFIHSMGRSAKAPMLVGAIAGSMAAAGSLSKRKAYLDLRRRSRGTK
jgi:hypothetical protein